MINLTFDNLEMRRASDGPPGSRVFDLMSGPNGTVLIGRTPDLAAGAAWAPFSWSERAVLPDGGRRRGWRRV